ncbi:putative lipid II flippase FtsW [Marinicella sp. W31]|uniref:putative lipid II flippase FtsW n=1 Tax=Marinicella sp. W31 TaxID=3023713 RepID=UPI003757F400
MTAKSRKTAIKWYAVGTDRWLLLAVVSLLVIGIIMVASSSIAIAEKYNQDPFYYLKRHLVFISLGVFLSGFMVALSTEWMNKLSRLMMVLGLIGLLLIFLPGIGVTVNGAKRWINLGISRFQVVEAVKLALILYLAGYVVRQKMSLQNSMFGVMKPLLLVVVVALLLLMQPDFGSAVLLMIMTLFMIFLAGARYRDLSIISLVAASAMAVIAWAEPYRVKRLVNFIDPWADPYNAGFQLVQALIAVGRGEFGGVGIGGSVQKLFYLPEAHTDFIFAVYAEEFGFFGVMVLIGLFILLIYRMFVESKKAFAHGNEFAGYASAGIGTWLALQALLSMGVNLGMLPTKGLTLPFISSGGSAIMINIVAVAVVLRIAYENRRADLKAIRTRGAS